MSHKELPKSPERERTFRQPRATIPPPTVAHATTLSELEVIAQRLADELDYRVSSKRAAKRSAYRRYTLQREVYEFPYGYRARGPILSVCADKTLEPAVANCAALRSIIDKLISMYAHR
jgi:hypothetical protein